MEFFKLRILAIHEAEPDLPAMVQAMLMVTEKRVPAGLNQEAARIAEYFGPERICLRLQDLLGKM